ncbi:hypothetical protein [Novosphingobium resinovorum]|uniref:hypothetical protein n=1 Tax=Novosphingobium resinovorum TaxID=158500 RepID=UPI002ED431F1|nr:hypothetical protein [Novosphingobium resinovorum]
MQNLFRILFWLALVFAVTMAVLPHPPQIPGGPSDKFQHMLAFATLALLAVLGYPHVHKAKIACALILLGAGIEVVQMIPALHRDAEVMDLVADTFAILVMLGLAALALGFRRGGKGAR